MNKTAGKLPAVLSFLVLGGVLGVLPLEFGTIAQLLALATLLALAVTPGGRLSRLLRTGAYLVGAGVTGIVLLGWDVLRIRNICGTPGGQVQTPTGTSYDCYSIETLWFVLAYGALACVGTVLLYLDWRRGTRPEQVAT
jgi:hypothetical protein